MTQDMTQGNPAKLILFFSIPIIIGNLFQQFYNMVDAMVVGRFVGTEALAGVGATGAIMFTTIGFSLGLTSGFSVVISQRFGAGNLKGVKKSIAMSVYLSLIFSIFMTLVGSIFTRQILQALLTPDNILGYATDYLRLIFIGSAGLVFYNLFSCILRAVGDSKTPLYFLILASILNVVLDLVFVLVVPLGTTGVGLATTFAQGISAIICVIYTYKKQPSLKLEKPDWEWDRETVLLLIKLGIPAAFQTSIIGIGVIMMQVVVNEFGDTYVAGYTVASKIQQLATQPLVSIGLAMVTYVGQNLGAYKIKRIKSGVNQCLIIMTFATILAILCSRMLAEPLAILFVEETEVEVIALAKQYLNSLSLFYVFLSLIFVYRSSLQGLGNALIPMSSGFLELLFRIIATMYLPDLLGFDGVAYADAAAWISAVVLLVSGYYWKISKFKDSSNEEE